VRPVRFLDLGLGGEPYGRRPTGQGRRIGGDRRPDPARREVDLRLAAELAAGDALEQGGAEAAAGGRRDWRAAALGPGQFETAAGPGRPLHLDAAGLGRERAVLHRVGGQLVQRQRQRVGGPRIEHDLRAGPARLAWREPAELGGGDVADLGPAPARGGQQGVGGGHRLEPAGEGLQESVERGGLAGRLGGQRLHRRQHVLHPVVQLGHERVAGVVLGAPLSDVAHDADHALGLPGRGAGAVNPEHASVVRPDDPELDLEATALPQSVADRPAHGLEIIRVDVSVERLAVLGGHRACVHASDLEHARADRHPVALHVPFKLPEAGDGEGEARPLLFDRELLVRAARLAVVHVRQHTQELNRGRQPNARQESRNGDFPFIVGR